MRVAVVALLLLAALWFGRQRIAIHFVDRTLAAADVPAAYRITRLGPFTQRIEDLRLGDPAHPDLLARRVDLAWRYGLRGPVLASVDAYGVRLAGQWREGRLSLGMMDRLLARPGVGGTTLPDLRLALNDATIALRSPAGNIRARMTGSGHLAHDFSGRVAVAAPTLTLGGCTVDGAIARLALTIADRAPHIRGPVTLAGVNCIAHSLTIGGGSARVDLGITPTLDSVAGRIALAGFAGRGGSIGFGATTGLIAVAGGAKDLTGRADLSVAGLRMASANAENASLVGEYRLSTHGSMFDGAIAFRGLAAPRAVAAAAERVSRSAAGSPIAPIAARIAGAAASLFARADVTAQLGLVRSAGRQSLRIDQAEMVSRGGERLRLSGSAGSDAADWRLDGHLAGTALPDLAVHAHRNGANAQIDALLQMQPYRAGGARLAITPLRIVRAAGATRFATVATIDGPLGSGRIGGLLVPLAGSLAGNGALRVGAGCTAVGFRYVHLPALTLYPGRIKFCGQPIVTRTADGTLRIAAGADDVALAGRSGASPLTLRVARLRLTGLNAFDAAAIAVTLGADQDTTWLAIDALGGRIESRGAAGRFANAAGSIRNVPLALAGAAGTWRLDKGAFRLNGALGVADRAAVARFDPVAAKDVSLTLADGHIHAVASLHPRVRDRALAAVTLDHDLAGGTGGARIEIPGIVFARNGLQPEMLTPLTLGVIANVVGTVTGTGRIDWSPAGVTSSGDFSSDRLDLAAAFGPISGLSGSIHFTDLLGLVTAPRQQVRIAEINPGVVVADGVAHYQLLGGDRVRIEDANWPFAGGTLALDPATLDFSQSAERRLTFHIARLDAAAFIQQLDFPNIAATGTFDGRLPMIFDSSGGRIEGGALVAESGGRLAYVGELSNAQLGTMGKLAFDALKAIRYSSLDISLDGRLDGEIVSRVRFEGVRQATGDASLVARMMRNLPFRFNIQIRAPFRGLVGSARSYVNPALLLEAPIKPAVQPTDSAPMR